MTRYLVVAHQTATSLELLEKVTEIANGDSHSTFTVLVPATPVQHLLVWEDGESMTVAAKRAEMAKTLFESRDLKVVRTAVGDSSPMLAIEDELRQHPDEHDAIVLSTLAPGSSRWLRLDVHHQAEGKFGIPVVHVVANLPR